MLICNVKLDVDKKIKWSPRIRYDSRSNNIPPGSNNDTDWRSWQWYWRCAMGKLLSVSCTGLLKETIDRRHPPGSERVLCRIDMDKSIETNCGYSAATMWEVNERRWKTQSRRRWRDDLQYNNKILSKSVRFLLALEGIGALPPRKSSTKIKDRPIKSSCFTAIATTASTLLCSIW